MVDVIEKRTTELIDCIECNNPSDRFIHLKGKYKNMTFCKECSKQIANTIISN